MTCKFCGSEVGNEDKCPICGGEINDAPSNDVDEFFGGTTEKTQSQILRENGQFGKVRYCKFCGKQVHPEAVVCVHCGCAIQPMKETQNTQVPETPKNNGMAIAGFVCSFFIPLLGWIFGGIGLAKSKKLGGKGKGFSIAAIAIASGIWFINFLINFMYY